MKKGFTIIEVSILFIIFLIVAFLVAPLSIDDTVQAKHTSKWRSVQQEFSNIFHTIRTAQNDTDETFKDVVESIINKEVQNSIIPYNIKLMNGSKVPDKFVFDEYKETFSKATIAVKFYDNNNDGIKGLVLYDVNGKTKPNTWGKDVFALNIYEDRFEPLGKTEPIASQRQDCSKNGTGVYCSNFYLIGGNFD